MPISPAKRDLGIILGLGFVFRLLFLGHRQLRTDELMQALLVRSDTAIAMLRRMRGGPFLPTPLDPLIQRVSVFFLGESDWTLRFHAVLFGTLSLWIFFRIARRLFEERVALYSTALFALYPLHYHYSQESLPYALCTFLALLSYDLLLQSASCAGRNWRVWLAWSLVQVLLLFSSLAGLAILVSQWVVVIVFGLRRLKVLSRKNERDIGEGKPDAPAAGWHTVLTFTSCAVLASVPFLAWARYAWTLRSAGPPDSLTFRLIIRIFKELGDGSYPVMALLIAGVAIGVRAMLRHGRRESLLWFSAWFAVPFPVVFLLDRWAGGPFILGQVLPNTAPLYLIAGYGLSYIGEQLCILDQLPFQISSAALVYAAGLGIMCVVIAQNHWRREPADWRGAAHYLQETIRTGDTLIVPSGLPLLEYYVPSLGGYQEKSPHAGPAASTSGHFGRRITVCLAASNTDPCVSLRSAAAKDRTWSVREFSGMSIFVRDK